MLRYILVVLTFCFSTASFAEKVLRLTSGEWPPYLSERLPHYGYASHLISEAFAAVGVKVEYGFFPWKRSYLYANHGEDSHRNWHGSVVWLYTEERAKNFWYSQPVIEEQQMLFCLKENPCEWESMGALEGKTIGGTLHTSYPLLEQAKRQGLVNIEKAGDYETLFKRLLAGRIDAVPQVWKVGQYFLRSHLDDAEQQRITFAPTAIDTQLYHLIISKRDPENKSYVKLFNQGLKKIKHNGTYQKLQDAFSQGLYDLPVEGQKRESNSPLEG